MLKSSLNRLVVNATTYLKYKIVNCFRSGASLQRVFILTTTSCNGALEHGADKRKSHRIAW